MLGARDTPTEKNGEHSEDSEQVYLHLLHLVSKSFSTFTFQSLPATLDDFQSAKPVEAVPPPLPTIHDPPSIASAQPAPQRFKKGNLRLMQSEDGGWKLEELEEKRRSLESQRVSAEAVRNESFEKKGGGEEGVSPRSGEKPPPAEAKRSKKKSSREEKGEGGGPSLMRKPSMKKLKAFFDKDKNKENKAEKEPAAQPPSDADYASAVSKLPTIEPGSKSVPSSLDR